MRKGRVKADCANEWKAAVAAPTDSENVIEGFAST